MIVNRNIQTKVTSYEVEINRSSQGNEKLYF